MAKKIPAEAGKFQHIYESGLKWVAFVIGALHLLLSMLFYFFESLTASLRNAEKWAVLVWIVAVLVYLLVTKAKYPRLMPRITGFVKKLCCPEMTLLLLFFVWFVICTISANDRYTANFFLINDLHLFNVFVDVVILFPMAFYLADSGSQRVAEIFIHFVLAILTGVMIFVLYRLLTLNIINLPDGGQIGMTIEQRLSINCHGNTTGAYSEIIMLFCLCMALRKKGIIRWLYAFSFAVHFIVMILSNSRACFLASALAIAFIAAKAVFDVLNDKSVWLRLASSLASAIAAIGILLLLRRLIFIEFENITHLSALLAQSSSSTSASSPDASSVAAAADSAARALDLNGHGRDIIWKAALRSVFTDFRHILCGVTPAGVISEISILTDKQFQMYAHNEFLEVAVSVGLPGLALYCAWLYRQARYCIADTLKQPKAYLPAIMLMLVSANMLESTLMFYWFLPESTFFLTAGVITYSRKK